ncbi:hypothetical protein JTE90_014889 [Oedothorax gibbosus]|uniref:CCHC-type domain-containing protein n=1 Tax=Oedothorax gibbosus TaxID=931172 RepID=A0AAV6TX33_9ARAC|nr:hypothetical protein JTE90_014889 [Oedothorax gibbosus]
MDEWAECNDPGELADKFEAFENLRSGVRRGPNPDYKKRNFHKQKDEAPRRENFREPFPQRRDENRRPEARRENTRFNNRTPDRNGQEGRKKLQCFSCGSYEHLRNKCPRLGQRTQAATNRVDVQPMPIEEGAPHILTAKISVPVSTPIDHKEKINELKRISLKCGTNVIEGIVDTGAQISVIRADLISDLLCDGAGKIKIVSAFGETELAQLKVIHMKINDGRHGEVPITCAISEKLVSEMLVSWSAFEALNANIELFGSEFSPVKDEVEEELHPVALSNEISSLGNDTTIGKRRLFVQLQKEDEMLKEAWDLAREKKENFGVQDEVLIHTEVVGGEEIQQVVLPLVKRQEVPHSTTGVSPFQLVYGRIPRGPLGLIKDAWTGESDIPTGASSSIEKYIDDLQERIRTAHEIAAGNTERAQESYTSRYNLRSKEKTFEVGEKVLVLIPSSSHKLLKTWSGPATVVQLTRPHSALIEFEDKSRREFHFNKLRPYIARVEQVGLIFEQDEEFGDISYAPTSKKERSFYDIQKHIHGQEVDVTREQKEELAAILNKYLDVFDKIPGQAKVPGHGIRVTEDCKLKRLHPYRVPVALQEEVERQVQELLDLRMIEPSESEWAHPVVCAAKKNGSVRLCVDYK